MSDSDVEERELRMAQVRADIENKNADTDYKRAMGRSEPIKLIATLFAAAATVIAATFGALGYILGRGH